MQWPIKPTTNTALTACWTTATTPAETPGCLIAVAGLAVELAGFKVLDQQVARP
jgi:hypothetical protein